MAGAKRDFALIKHGHLLSELDDIDITSPSDNSLLQYDSASGTWQDVSLASFNSQLDHGLLSGLADDDHTQYHTDARALTWLGTRSTTDLPEGARLYFTDERAQDAVGLNLVDSSSIDFTYDDGAGTITAATINANPTGTIGLTAVNGSAATPMRSDGAPALSQAIAPTWTGKHTFSNRKTLVPTDAVAGGYLAHNPTLPEATLDSIVSGVGNLYVERLMRVVRATSPVFGGLTYGAALTAANPAAPVSGDVLVDFRGSAYRDNTFSTLTDGMSWTARALENWDSTHAGTEALVNLIPSASTSQVNVLTLRNTYMRLPIDNQELQIGAGQDLRIYHDGTDSIIENDTGNLIIRVNGELRLEEVTTSTGAVTCTLGTNAPAGVGTTTPTTWMTLNVGGTDYFIPLWT